MSFDYLPSNWTPPAHTVCREARLGNPQLKDDGEHKDDNTITKGKGTYNNSGNSEQPGFDLPADLSNVSIQIPCIHRLMYNTHTLYIHRRRN